MSLWLCLRLTQLPLECQNHDEHRPVAVVEQRRLLCLNSHAGELGLREGMGMAQAQALCAEQSLLLLSRDHRQEQRTLERLACWAYSISPVLHIWQEHSLLLEVGGCLRLFGGAHRILELARNGLSRRGHQAHCALAETRKAAWLLSFRPAAEALEHARPLQERLAQLPLSLLYPLCSELRALEQTGLSTVGELLALPGTALAERCSPALRPLLEQLLGHRHDGVAPFQPPARFADQLHFGYEVKARAEMRPAMQHLLEALERFLTLHQLRTRQLDWIFIGQPGQRQCLRVRSSTALGLASAWQSLSDVAMEGLQWQWGVQTIALRARSLEALTAAETDLFSTHSSQAELHVLPDQLRNRLGLQAILQLQQRDEHLPERAVYRTPLCSSPPERTPGRCAEQGRPFWLLPEPQPLSLGADGALYWQGPLRLLYGPERLEDGWWQQPCSRDYYVAEGATGNRYWIFHERLQRRWYVHGLFV